jgi:hypothetical protein
MYMKDFSLFSLYALLFLAKKRVLHFIPGLVPPMPLPERAPPPPKTAPWMI